MKDEKFQQTPQKFKGPSEITMKKLYAMKIEDLEKWIYSWGASVRGTSGSSQYLLALHFGITYGRARGEYMGY